MYTKLVDKNTVSEEEVLEYFYGTKERDDIIKLEKTDDEVKNNTMYLYQKK